MDVLYIVVPCYNEQEVLRETAAQLAEKLSRLREAGKISPDSRILFVDDGSQDSTWSIIEQLNGSGQPVCGLKLSRNRGHQNALLAGLMTAKSCADMVISMDADLQDDVNTIEAFVDRFHEGYEIVYGVRSERKTDTFFKRNSALLFYRLIQALGTDVVYNHADFRLMSRRALVELEKFREVNLFLRGMVPLLGFRSTTVPYERHERFAGQSKYPLRKMLSFAAEGILSFSVRPIRLIMETGILIFLVSIVLLIYFLIVHFQGRTVPGWTTIAVSTWAIGGLQLLATGIIGEYIGKIYLEAKARPKYIIEKFLQ